MDGLPHFARSGSNDFQRVVDAFLSRPGLPFADVLSAERIERIFSKNGNLFGTGAIYSTAVMVWSFLGQILRDGKEASCQAAVARVVSWSQQQGTAVPTSDTGDYCKARAKLSEAALRDLTREIANVVEEQANSGWLWKGRHAKLIDGFTFTMPDTAANQAEYPQQKSQNPVLDSQSHAPWSSFRWRHGGAVPSSTIRRSGHLRWVKVPGERGHKKADSES